MGRHHIKLPEHLYISSSSPEPTSTFTSASTSFYTKTPLLYTSAAFFLHTVPTTQTLERRIPGFKTSAAFLSALRANLDLQIDPLESPATTPDSLRPTAWSSSISHIPSSPLAQEMSNSSAYTDGDFAPPSALNLPKASTVKPEEDEIQTQDRDPNAIPELTTLSANDEATRIEALRLVADSVAQQRQRANRALIFHPITIGFLAVVFGLLRQYFYKGSTSDYAIIGTTFAGILMSMLLGIRWVSSAYIDEAERVGTWRWLGQGRGPTAEQQSGKTALGEDGDEILLTKFGNEFIGTIVFRGVQPIDPESPTSKKSRKANAGTQPRTEIRAWAVRQKYRNKGVGTALVEDAIKIAHERGWASGGIEVAADHANSKIVLPKIFSGFVQKNGDQARKLVEAKVKEFGVNGSGKGKRRR